MLVTPQRIVTNIRLDPKTRANGGRAVRQHQYNFRARQQDRSEDLMATGWGNLPTWAKNDPKNFWEAADEFEGVNRRVYNDVLILFPRELSLEENTELLKSYLSKELKDLPYSFAVHHSSSLDGGENPHCHVMMSERKLDGVERTPEIFFKRPNYKYPEKGGVKKDRDWNDRTKLERLRVSWADEVNVVLERKGLDKRADLRSYKRQGIDIEPEPKMEKKASDLLKVGILTKKTAKVLQLRERRNSPGQYLSSDKILKAVKDNKWSVYRELDVAKKAQYEIGGYRSKTNPDEVLFHPSNDPFIHGRRKQLTERYQKLQDRIQALKDYEKELMLIGTKDLKIHKDIDYSTKEALIDREHFDSLVQDSRRHQDRVRALSSSKGLKLSRGRGKDDN
ncbi:MobA/MobL family protein [Hyella patelloides]|nr:MobA/MobL family protein [Hyella patelloides]